MMNQDESQGRHPHLDLSDALIAGLQPRVLDWRDSTTYQKILRDGRAEGLTIEARRILLRQGTKRFGMPDAVVIAALEGIRDLDRLEDLCERILDPDVGDWDGLMGLS